MAKTKGMVRDIIEIATAKHKEEFGVSLTKKEMREIITYALEDKRQKWLKARLGDHTISELILLLEVIDERKKAK